MWTLTDAEGHGRPQLAHWQLGTEVILRVEQRGVLEVDGDGVAAQDLCSASRLPAGALLLHHHLVLTADTQKDTADRRLPCVASNVSHASCGR